MLHNLHRPTLVIANREERRKPIVIGAVTRGLRWCVYVATVPPCGVSDGTTTAAPLSGCWAMPALRWGLADIARHAND